MCEHFGKDHMENIDNKKEQQVSEVLTPEAKKSILENCNEDLTWTSENVDTLLDRFEAQLKQAECNDSDS